MSLELNSSLMAPVGAVLHPLACFLELLHLYRGVSCPPWWTGHHRAKQRRVTALSPVSSYYFKVNTNEKKKKSRISFSPHHLGSVSLKQQHKVLKFGAAAQNQPPPPLPRQKVVPKRVLFDFTHLTRVFRTHLKHHCHNVLSDSDSHGVNWATRS